MSTGVNWIGLMERTKLGGYFLGWSKAERVIKKRKSKEETAGNVGPKNAVDLLGWAVHKG